MKLEALKKLGGRLRLGFGRFMPFNLVAIAVAIIALLDDHNVIQNSTASNLACGLYWGALVGVALRLYGELRDKSWLKLAAWPVTAIFGAIGCWFWFSVVEDSPRYAQLVMVFIGTIIALFASCVNLLYRVGDEKTLVSRLVISAIGVWGSTMIFICSIELCVCAFDKLICKVPSDLYGDVFLFCSLTMLPVGFASLLPNRNTNSGDLGKASAFFFWLLLPASLLLLAILYIYLGRIALTQTMPSGELNWFGSIALAVYAFFWLALRDSTRTFFRRFVRWGWLLLIPVLTAQVIGIVIRYNAYGLTASRFAGMITLSVGVFTLVLAALNRRPNILFTYIAIIGLVFTLTPLNIIDVPIRNQESRLLAVFERNGIDFNGEIKASEAISDTDAEIILGAWNYLRSSPEVYHHSPVTALLKEKLGKDALAARLGIDESKIVHRSRRDCGDWSSVTIKFAGNGKVPVGEYKFVKLSPRYAQILTHDDGRYTLKLEIDAQGKEEEFDVTSQVKRIFDATGWDGVIHSESLTYEVPSEYANFELRPDLAAALGDTEINFHGRVGSKFDALPVGELLLLYK